MHQIGKIKKSQYVHMKSGSENTFFGIVDVPYPDGSARCTLAITWGPSYEIASVARDGGKMPTAGDVDFVRRLVFKDKECVLFRERAEDDFCCMCMIREKRRGRLSR